MPTNLDPTGPLPPANPNGQLDLAETNTSFFIDIMYAFPILAIAILSSMYWASYFAHGQFPVVTDKDLNIIGRFGVLALPAIPYFLGRLLFPPKLVLTADAIQYSERWSKKAIPWTQVSDIALQTVISRNRYSSTSQTLTMVAGGQQKLKFRPVFGVAPATLVSYIQRQAESAGCVVNVRQAAPTDFNPMLWIMLAVLAVVLVISVPVIILAYLVINNNQFAINLASHLPNL